MPSFFWGKLLWLRGLEARRGLEGLDTRFCRCFGGASGNHAALCDETAKDGASGEWIGDRLTVLQRSA